MTRIALLVLLLLTTVLRAQEGAVHPATIDEYLLQQLGRFGPAAAIEQPPPGMTTATIFRGGEVVTITVPIQQGQSPREDRRRELQRLLLEADRIERARALENEIMGAVTLAEAALADGGGEAERAKLAALAAIQAEIEALLAAAGDGR